MQEVTLFNQYSMNLLKGVEKFFEYCFVAKEC